MRAGSGRVTLLELAHQLLHLLGSECLSGFDGSPLAYRGDEALFSLRSQRIVALSQQLENVHQGSTDIRHDQDSWHGSEEVAGPAEGFYGKAYMIQKVEVLAELTSEDRIQVQGQGFQQGL